MLITLLIYLTLFFFSLGQLGRISFLGQQVNLYVYELFLFTSLASLVVKHKLKPITSTINKFKITYLFFILLGLSFLINIFHFQALENAVSVLYLVRLTVYVACFIYLLYEAKHNKKILLTIQKGLFIFISITIVSSILQYFFYPNLRNLIYLGWDPHLYRLFGVFFDTSTAGGVFGLILLFVFLFHKPLFKSKLINYSILVTYFIFILLTFSRGLYLSMAVTLLLLFLKDKKLKKALILIALFFVVGFVVIPKPFGEGVRLVRFVSIESRIKDYKNAISIWQKKPVFGVGYNRIRYVKKDFNILQEDNINVTHSGASFASSYLVILVSAGVIGLLLFLGVFWEWSSLGKYFVIFLGLFSLTDNIILQPFILFLLLQILIVNSLSLSGKSQ
jgi:O-antigen ligase